MFVKEPIDWEGKIKSLFQPDILLAVVYFGHFRQRPPLEAEKRLTVAVLEDGLVCFQKYLLDRSPKGNQLFQEAEAWIFEEDDDWPFSFGTICEILGFDPDYFRDGLLRWKEAALRKRSKGKFCPGKPMRVQNRTQQQRDQILAGQGR